MSFFIYANLFLFKKYSSLIIRMKVRLLKNFDSNKTKLIRLIMQCRWEVVCSNDWFGVAVNSKVSTPENQATNESVIQWFAIARLTFLLLIEKIENLIKRIEETRSVNSF